MTVKIELDNEDPNDGGFDINVPATASPEEVEELDKELGVTAPAAEPSPSEAEGDDPLDIDESASEAKTSAEEAAAGTDAEREAIRARKKEDRLNQRQRARARIESLERQLANALATNHAIQQRVGNLENTNLGSQAAQLERMEQENLQAEAAWSNIVSEAVAKQDGPKVAEGFRALTEIQSRKTMIANAKVNLEQQSRAPRAQPLDTEVVNNAKAFMAENPWYNPKATNDMDSQILTMIDNTLTREGWDPRSPSYWNELKARAAKRIPERFKPATEGKPDYNAATAPERRAPKSPVAGSSSSNSGGGKTTFTLSPDRVRLMKEAGSYFDLERRADMIKRYMEIDKQLAADKARS